MFLVLAVVVSQVNAAEDSPNDLMVKVGFYSIANKGDGDVTKNVYVGRPPEKYGELEWIPLTQNGVPIIDSGMKEEVPGLAMQRGNGWVIISLWGWHGLGSYEKAYGWLNFDNAYITGFENCAGSLGEKSCVEKQGDGVWEERANQNEVVWEEGAITARFYLWVVHHSDTFKIYYEPYCGNNVVDSGEQCDPPKDPSYKCKQDKEVCQKNGHKLGTRPDVWGSCDATCQCANDPLVYQCVQWECGAECDEDSDCAPYGTCSDNCLCIYEPYCGDGNIDPGEECELPVTSDNSYCDQQPTTQCVGNKTASRDSLGDCDSECGCVLDPFGPPVCIKDSCGAECDSDDDCNLLQLSIIPSTTFYCNLDTCMCEQVEPECGNGIIDAGEECEPPNTVLSTCDYGEDYLQDYCDANCHLQDDECEDDYPGCTSDPECDEDTPGTGDCDMQCQYEQLPECGNGKLEVGEDCEPPGVVLSSCNYGADYLQDYCDSNCHLQEDDCEDDYPGCISDPECDEFSPGTFNCDMQCQYEQLPECGDGSLDPGEECEYPGDTDDTSCPQNPEECFGKKLGVRDNYGDCISGCFCDDDQFQLSCVQGECGAACDSNDDCDDFNSSTIDSCDMASCLCEHEPTVSVCGNQIIEPGEECEPPGVVLSTCTYGADYLQDYCDANCHLQDDDCEDDYPGCISDLECDEAMPGTGDCDMQCQYEQPVCGNGILEAGEDCEPPGVVLSSCNYGADYLQDYCDSNCHLQEDDCEDDYPGCISDPECDEFSPGTFNCDMQCQYEEQPFCGDGILNPGEQCESPGDANDSDCPQNPEECFNHKLGIRDNYGNCVANCLCDEDQFLLSCVQNECGAECDSNDDCDDSNSSTIDSCNMASCVCEHQPTQSVCGNGKLEAGEECEPPGVVLSTCSYGADYLQDYCDQNCHLQDDECEDDYPGCTSDAECDEDMPGTDGCDMQCQYEEPECGNGDLDLGEECELPVTNDNSYCNQQTTDCLGNKKGVRDGFGDCDSNCGCTEDNFMYQCVKWYCGAECDSNDDCSDCDPNTVDTCDLDTCMCEHEQGQPECGNQIIEPGEECEPPNTVLATCNYGADYLQDYCDANCHLQDDDCEDDYPTCTSDPECDEAMPGTGDCDMQCQYEEQPQCGNSIVEAGEECELPNTVLSTCTYGADYLQDYCDANCHLQDDQCEDDYPSCTSDPECDEAIPGTGDCNMQCEYTIECGDGNIDFGEECEYPNTPNNSYCGQNNETCDGHKFGVRDLFGNCNLYCGCVDDQFVYECMEGECGAECLAGESDSQSCGNDTGECSPGEQWKTCGEDCIWGSWGPCRGMVGPTNEICDGLDNDCDGFVDENLTQSCGSGNCAGISECIDGVWTNCSTNGQDAGVCAICNANGQAIYDETQDVDCPATSCPDNCGLSPDNNPLTWDYANDVPNECIGLLTCSENNCSYNHECSVLQCSAECDATHSCEDNECSETYNDYCDGLELVEYDNDKVLDSTTVDDSCSNSCEADCTCTDCDPDCSAPSTNSYCVENVCGAECDSNADCEDGNMFTQDTCLDNCSCYHEKDWFHTEDFPPHIWLCDNRVVIDDDINPGRVDGPLVFSAKQDMCECVWENCYTQCVQGAASYSFECEGMETPCEGEFNIQTPQECLTFCSEITVRYGCKILKGYELVERTENYAFEGEKIEWIVLVMDKNKIEQVTDVVGTVGPVQGTGNPIEVECVELKGWAAPGSEILPECNARIDEEEIDYFDDQIMAYYECTLTVETPASMHGQHWITVEAIDSTGLSATMDENEYWFLNPEVGVSVDGFLNIGEVRPGTIVYSDSILVKNDVEEDSGVMLDMFISGTDFYDPSNSGARCSLTNRLKLGNNFAAPRKRSGNNECQIGFNDGDDHFCYYAVNGAYSTQNDPRSDAEGYAPIVYGDAFSRDFYNDAEIIMSPLGGLFYSPGNVLSPGAEISLTFKLGLPLPCNGDFSDGSIYFWGEPI